VTHGNISIYKGTYVIHILSHFKYIYSGISFKNYEISAVLDILKYVQWQRKRKLNTIPLFSQKSERINMY
jgi:hypothetical protein